MISYISGEVIAIGEHSVTIMTGGGVGYTIYVPISLVASCEKGSTITIPTYLKVAEQVLDLYGFESLAQRDIFLTLLKVSGVGAKTAISILSAGSSEQLSAAISAQDVAFLKSVPGIGKKTAERIIVELKDAMSDVVLDSAIANSDPAQGTVIEALLSIGYAREEIMRALTAVDTANLTEEQILKKTLQLLSR